LRWARHLGREDGSFRWEDFKTVGTGWGHFTHVFSGGDGIIYAIEPVVEAGLTREGEVVPASGGRLRWARHLGREDGSFRWEDFKTVGTGWGHFTHVFSGSAARRAPRSISEATAAILSHYPRVGGPTGPVGVPMGDVTPIPGGYMRPHSAGHIQLLDADIGPQGFHTMEASVRFVGFRCHQQSEGGPDEPYFIIGVQGFNQRDETLRTFGPFEGSEGVETGDIRFLEAQLTTTASPPFVIHVTAMENDSGTPAEASAAVEKGMKDGTAMLTAALAPIDPATVFAVGGAVQAFLGILGGPIADGLSSLFGMGDDFIGQNSMPFFDYDRSKKEWLNPPPKQSPNFDRPFNVEMVLDNGEGGRYSAFFAVALFKIDKVAVAAGD
jgi:hypothetical protein